MSIFFDLLIGASLWLPRFVMTRFVTYYLYMFDLHLHSNRSDGQLAPLKLAEHLVGLGYRGFSITDHNYLAADAAHVRRYAESFDLRFIAGIEISSRDPISGESLHVLGYGNELDSVELNDRLAPVRAGYDRRAKNIIAKLNRGYSGLNLDFERLSIESGSSYLDRNRLAAELRRFKNDGSTLKDLLPEVFVEESNDWLPETDAAIRLINDCGGLAVLAHPGRLMDRDKNRFDRLVGHLAAVGLRGLEAYYASHTPEQTELLSALAKKADLIVTGGSDWHGPDFSADKTPGCDLPQKHFERFLKSIT